MSKKIQLSIPKPCHEDWNAMSPVEKGKFCGSCQKQVVDFSTMSDRQVAQFFKKPSTGSVCGRFMADQLERDIEIPKKRLPWFKYFFSIALPAVFFAKATAQNGQKMGKVKPATRDTVPPNFNQDYRTLGMVALSDKFIPVEKGKQKGEEGRVVDALTNMFLPGAQVYLFSTIGKEKIYVQRDGSFIIDIYRKITVDRIEISLRGYISKTLSLAEFMKAANAKEPIQMERENMIMGDIDTLVCDKQLMGDTLISPVMGKPSIETIKGEIQPAVSNKKREISGRVEDENGSPIQGASVIIKRTRSGVATDNKGNFKIVAASSDTLVFSGGIDLMEIVIGNESFLKVKAKRPLFIGGEITVIIRCFKPQKSFPVIPMKFNETISHYFKVFPNPIPSGSNITIEWKQTEEGYYNLELINQAGQPVHQRQIWIDAEARQLSFDTPVVPAGSYFVVLTNKKTGKKFSEKIIIQ